MTTSWKKVCSKLKMNGIRSNARPRVGSDDNASSTNSDIDTITTNSSTPQFTINNRSSFDNEWQMNYMIINRKDGL